jgi:alkanesulfonate monooxygenase SsuD/methylene tetrahydromethanopterin reductase-like flavin-dependent oxidoreductase (luciferase family)
MVIGSPALLADRIADLAKAGADTVYLHIFDIHDLDHIALIGAEVLPQLAALP